MNRFYIPLILFILFLSSNSALAQFYNTVDWGTYFSDSTHYPTLDYTQDDLIDQVITDNNDPESIYVCGKTYASSNQQLSTCSGHVIKMGSDVGYFAKYDRCGHLMWSTYIGGYAQSIAFDIQEGKKVLYVAGHIIPPTGPTAAAYTCDGSASPIFQVTPSDKSEGLIAKYQDNDTSVTLLRWTYFGGSLANGGTAADNILSIAILNHNIFGTGDTKSPNIHYNPFHGHALNIDDSTYGGGGDGFICEFDSMLSTLKFFTYIGGSLNDRGHDIKVRSAKKGRTEIFASGTASDFSGIGYGTGFDTTFNGQTDAYIIKYKDGNGGDGIFIKQWGTFIGGSEHEHSRSSVLDDDGNIFLTGYTSSTDMPKTPTAYDTSFGVNSAPSNFTDCFVTKVKNNGSLAWNTYLGGDKDDTGNGIALFKNGSTQYVVVAGLTKTMSTNFPLVSPIQDKLNGNDSSPEDGFISILTDVSGTQQQLVYSTYVGGSGVEGVKTGISYHPSIIMGPHKELYFVIATKSADINSVIGSEYQNTVHAFNGGSGCDAFIAKLIDVNNVAEYNCTFQKTENIFSQTSSGVNALQVYPDPFENNFTVQIISDGNEQAAIQVYNELGVLMQTIPVSFHQGMNELPIDISTLSSGIYFIRIMQSEKIISAKVTKQ